LELEAEARHDAAAIAQAPRSPIFSGERLYRSDPERYALFCRLYFEAGLSQMESCRLLSMSPQSGAAIISREQASMSAARLRQVQAARARAVVSLSLSAMQDRLSDSEALAAVPLRDLAQAAQRAQEIAALLSGEATSRVERPDAGKRAADDAHAYLQSVDAECVEQSVLEGVSRVAHGSAEVDPAGVGVAGGDAESWGSDAGAVALQGVTDSAMPEAVRDGVAPGAAGGGAG
jgi:hypothetical protein